MPKTNSSVPRRNLLAYYGALYGSTLATLIVLYFVSTRIFSLPTDATFWFLAFCGLLVVGAMIRPTCQAFRDEWRQDGD
jgi:hypothetical protein